MTATMTAPAMTRRFGSYAVITTGRLRGVYIGGGGNALGRIGLHPSWTVPIKSEPVVLVDAMVGYATNLGELPLDLRLNVRNLTDEHYLNGTFQYGEARTVRVSAVLKF